MIPLASQPTERFEPTLTAASPLHIGVLERLGCTKPLVWGKHQESPEEIQSLWRSVWWQEGIQSLSWPAASSRHLLSRPFTQAPSPNLFVVQAGLPILCLSLFCLSGSPKTDMQAVWIDPSQLSDQPPQPWQVPPAFLAPTSGFGDFPMAPVQLEELFQGS